MKIRKCTLELHIRTNIYVLIKHSYYISKTHKTQWVCKIESD
jgi:hypothetical protein